MPVDATGAVTTKLSIPKYATGADAPSGKGFNNVMDSLDTIIASLGIAGLVANDVPVYDSVAGKWKKATGAPSSSTFLRGDGSWAALSMPSVVVADTTLGVSGNFSFTGIPATYTHLRLVGLLRLNGAVVNGFGSFTFNNDGATNYDWSAVQQVNAAAPAGNGAGTNTNIAFNYVPGASATANRFANIVIDIPFYAQTTGDKHAHMHLHSFDGTNINTFVGSGNWRSTAAINRIDVSGTYAAGSRVMLYGIS